MQISVSEKVVITNFKKSSKKLHTKNEIAKHFSKYWNRLVTLWEATLTKFVIPANSL